MSQKILVVDDEKNITFVIDAFLRKAGYETLVLNDGRLALDALEKDDEIDVVVTDLFMPNVDGMKILDFCREKRPDIPVVMITAHGTIEAAVSALKKGAFDFITKPFDQIELLNAVKKASRTAEKNHSEFSNETGFVVGPQSPMLDVIRVVQKVADTPTTVVIWGESGTGKERVAYELHRLSSRKDRPFIKINCGAIPATLIESELFGHEKGAFTGASTSKPGRFELAHEGTLFLDEVAEMSAEMQVKLLRVLQEHEFERVGGVSTIKVDVRIITATNKNLEQEVKEGRFREDLFYRLNVLPIWLPPLRERPQDINVLVKVFLDQFNKKLGKNISKVEPECLAALTSYEWPGNIRQLENVLERAVLMAEGDSLCVEDLPSEIGKSALSSASHDGLAAGSGSATSSSSAFKDIVRGQVRGFERDLIEKALEETGGNVTRTAEKLGLSRKGLQLKMKELGVKRTLWEEPTK